MYIISLFLELLNNIFSTAQVIWYQVRNDSMTTTDDSEDGE